jgi:hypothetical protein
MGAGAVNASLVARLPGKARSLGPVAAVSFRVASRIVNSIGAGTAARTAGELDGVRVILFHSSAEQFAPLFEALTAASIDWAGKSLIFCDCEIPAAACDILRARGASVATLRRTPLPARLVVEGCAPALAIAHRMARDLGMKAIEITPQCSDAFETALTLGSGALTPLIDHAAGLLRQCGVRDTEAPRLAAALFEQTARDYARTGRQSWAWYQRAPETARLGGRLRGLVAQLILFGLEEFGRHPEAVKAIKSAEKR